MDDGQNLLLLRRAHREQMILSLSLPPSVSFFAPSAFCTRGLMWGCGAAGIAPWSLFEPQAWRDINLRRSISAAHCAADKSPSFARVYESY